VELEVVREKAPWASGGRGMGKGKGKGKGKAAKGNVQNLGARIQMTADGGLFFLYDFTM
jgi:hypothetical protein